MQKTTRPERRPPTTVPTRRAIHDAELVDDMADFLDEVDALIEEEDEFLLSFRQRGVSR